MQRYVEMGYSEHEAQQAEELHGDDLHAGCHWLMLRQTLGQMPKRLKSSRNATDQTYLGSSIRYDGAKWTIDDFNSEHALIRIFSPLASVRKWIHMSDNRIEWDVIRHETSAGIVPKPAWYRKIGQIQLDITKYSDSEQSKELSLANILNRYIRSHRPDEPSEFYKWRMINALTKQFRHQPSHPKPRSSNASDLHGFRVELMTYFHALCDVCSISKEMFNDLLYNNTTKQVTELFPENEREHLKKQINIWKKPKPFLVREMAKWRQQCVPVVIFSPTVIIGNPATSFLCDVVIHDLTFVRPEMYEVSMNVLHFQCLFNHIYQHTIQAKVSSSQVDNTFLEKVLRTSRKMVSSNTVPSSSFTSSLFSYQQKCLTWLIHRENKSESTSSWGWTRHQLSDGFVYYTSCFGYISQSSPNNTIRGGLLAQSVGMGKTIEMLALIATNPVDGPTLIVVPTTMLSVWLEEAQTHCPSLTVVRFHGSRRGQIPMDTLKSADIVVTTYRICVNETQRHIPTIGSIRWGRIILDESHELKNPTSATVKAMCRLYAPRKWCLSATPFPKGLVNMASLLSFMGVTPFVDNITPSPERSNTPIQMLFRRPEESFVPSHLSTLLQQMTFWQKKRHVRINLPPSTHVKLEVELLHPEVYRSLCHSISRRLARDSAHSNQHQKARVLHYMRWLRLASTQYDLNPPFVYALIQDSNRAPSTTNSIDEFINSLGTTQYDHSLRDLIESWLQGNETCCICRDAMERPTLTPCQHMFCYECIQQSYEHDPQRRCPLCRTPAGHDSLGKLNSLRELTLTADTSGTISEEIWSSVDHQGNPVSMPQDIFNKMFTVSGAKIIKLFEIIRQNTEKYVIFTQYHCVLKLLVTLMELENINSVTIEGRMTPNQRAKNIESFQKSQNVRCFIMTTKTASVGITLTESSNIIFMEPCIDSHVRKQAIGRVLRIGQTKPVTVTTLITKDTFETKSVSEFKRHIDLMTSL